MGVLDINRAQIVNGGLISASFVSDLYDVLTGNISDSITITGGITGNLLGIAATASYYNGQSISSNTASFNYVNVSDTFIVEGTIFFYTASLSETDPGINGQLWRSGSYLMISTGSAI
jgi:lipoprotein signal peptidase